MIVISGARVITSGSVKECRDEIVSWFDTVRRLKGNKKPTGLAVWRAILRLRAGRHGIISGRLYLEVRSHNKLYNEASCRIKANLLKPENRLKEAMNNG